MSVEILKQHRQDSFLSAKEDKVSCDNQLDTKVSKLNSMLKTQNRTFLTMIKTVLYS